MTNMMTGAVAIYGGYGAMEICQPLPQVVENTVQAVEELAVNAHISLRELKDRVDKVLEKKVPGYKNLMAMNPEVAARTTVNGATLTVYTNGYATYEADDARTVLVVDRCGDFTIPFVQSIHTVNNKQQDKQIEDQIWGEASDKTPVYAADVIVTYQVLPEKSAWLYANVSDIKNLLGDELVASAVKSAMSELGPEDVTNRTKVEPLAQRKLAESLTQKYGEGAVFVNKVVINDMDFEEAYNAAIQQKSIAQQNAARQKIENEATIAKAEADKQVAITNAEAEAQKTSIAAEAQAEANRKIANSLSDTLIEYQKVQKWDGKLPTVSGGNALVSIDPVE